MDDKVTISTFQLFALFPDGETARKYLEGRLWPNGVRCPVCTKGENITTRKAGFYRCNPCHEDFTVRTGTVMERSHVPLHKWLYAMYLLVTARKGISSMQLSKEIGITQKSAWFVLHRLREACGGDLDKLQGIVHGMKTPAVLDAVADKVLSYRPKAESKAAKKRQRKRRKVQRAR
jgi:transposase-like protein